MRTRNHWRIKLRAEDLMLEMFTKLKVKPSLKSLNFRFGFNFYSIKYIRCMKQE
jgi:hypothetical protein